MQVWVQMGWWCTDKKTHRSISTKICGVSNGLDWRPTWWWIHISSKTWYDTFSRVFVAHSVSYEHHDVGTIKHDAWSGFCFPLCQGTPFPPNFKEVVKTIFKRLFRVYAHIYHSHFQKIVSLKEEAHLNTCFKHFILFTNVGLTVVLLASSCMLTFLADESKGKRHRNLHVFVSDAGVWPDWQKGVGSAPGAHRVHHRTLLRGRILLKWMWNSQRWWPEILVYLWQYFTGIELIVPVILDIKRRIWHCY